MSRLIQTCIFRCTTWLPVLVLQAAIAHASGSLCQESSARSVQAVVKSGTTMADAEQLASALGATLQRPPNGSAFKLTSGSRTVGFFHGAYISVSSAGAQPIEVAPFRSSGRLYVPLRVAVEGLGAKLTGSGSTLSVQGGSGILVPVKVETESSLPTDPFERLLIRLENGPIRITESAKGALIGEAQLEVLDSSLELMEPALPVLKALGDSKIIALVGDLPGIGRPVQIVQHIFGASGEVVTILKWYSSVDKNLSRPLRKGILACDKQLKSRNRADLDSTIAGLEQIGGVAKEYQAMGFKSAAAMLKYKRSIDRFQKAVQSLAEAYGTTIPNPLTPHTSKNSVDLTSQLQGVFGALMRQANDLDRFSKDCLADARAAKAAGGR